MNKASRSNQLVPFDASEFLTDDLAVAEYITAVLETEDVDLILVALDDVVRARQMTQVAADTGLGREN